MVFASTAQLIVRINDMALDAEECDREYLRLLHELKHNPDIEGVYPIPISNLPEGSKSALDVVKNVLTAEITPGRLRPVVISLYHRLTRNLISLEVEANGRRLKVTAGSREDLDIAIQHAQRFIDQAPTSQESVR